MTPAPEEAQETRDAQDMEATSLGDTLHVPTTHFLAPLATSLRALAPGLLAALVIAGVASFVAPLNAATRVVGASVFAIVAGLVLRTVSPLPAVFSPGIRFASKRVLQASIVLLGTGLSLAQVWNTGRSSVVVMGGTLIVGLVVILTLGRALKVDETLARLIGVGTSICGASAIGAIAPVLEADEATIAYAISTVFLFNVAGVLLFPLLGHLMGLSQHGFGLWAGTAINDTSSVVAASAQYGASALAFGVVVKLARTVMIIPLSFVFAGVSARERRRDDREAATSRLGRNLPIFIVWFLLASLLNSVGVFDIVNKSGVLHVLGTQPLSALGQFFIVVALAAIGLSADLRAMIHAGWRPLALGLAGWVSVATLSLVLQHLTGGV